MAAAVAPPQRAERTLVVFVDIRGFTRLAQDARIRARLPALVYELYVDLDVLSRRHGLSAGPPTLKTLGDGAMLLLRPGARPAATLARVLAMAREAERRFQERLRGLAGAGRARPRSALGWGVTRGDVVPVRLGRTRLSPAFSEHALHGSPAGRGGPALDHYGACISRAKRLCDKARPDGVCVDAAAFPARPDADGYGVTRRTLKAVKGVADALPVWLCRLDHGGRGAPERRGRARRRRD